MAECYRETESGHIRRNSEVRIRQAEACAPKSAECVLTPYPLSRYRLCVPKRPSFVDSTVERRCPAGHPLVLKCYPLRRDREPAEPFPTLFWLACGEVARQIARLEYDGGVRAIEARIADDAGLRARVLADHATYVVERWELLTVADRARAESGGVAGALRDRGIGGIANRDSVKCLHLHYAHHLARGTAIGDEIERLGAIRLCAQEIGQSSVKRAF